MKHFVWWHLILGHDVQKLNHIWGTMVRWECHDCDLEWQKNLL